MSNDVISISDAAYASGSVTATNLRATHTSLGNCVNITLDTVDMPHVLTIDFGATDCTCLDGRSRRGEIIVTYTGNYKDSGSVHTITYNNYYVNDKQLRGNTIATNKGVNTEG